MQEDRDRPLPVDETDTPKEVSGKVVSFKTARGSVYTYDGDGKTTRFKTTTNEQQARQDLTVFVRLTAEDEEAYIAAYRSKQRRDPDERVYVLERQPDDSAQIIRDIAEVSDPQNLYLGIVKKEDVLRLVKASLIPTIGDHPFDTRRFQNEQGEWKTERHLGNEVVEINCAE